MSGPLILGTRGSALALAQARMTEAALAARGVACRIEVVRTIGDKRPDLALREFSRGESPVLDKGIFTKELEEALLARRIDFAVHSLKDVPTELAPEFAICATLPRAADADLVLSTREDLPAGESVLDPDWWAGRTVATSSVRRARQLSWLCPGVKLVDIRGNVPTRVRKLQETAEWDAILLARAGLERLGIHRSAAEFLEFEGARVAVRELPPERFYPAAGQGAVAMEILQDNAAAREALAGINHLPTFRRVAAERAFLARLHAGCQTPVGARTWFEDRGATLCMAVRVFDESDPLAAPFSAEARAPSERPEALAALLLERDGAPCPLPHSNPSRT